MNTRTINKLQSIYAEPTTLKEAKNEISKLRQKLYECLKEKQKIESQRDLYYQAISNKCIFYYREYKKLREDFKQRGKGKEYQEQYKEEIQLFFDLKYKSLTAKLFPFFLLVYKFREDYHFIKSFDYHFKESYICEEKEVSYLSLIDVEKLEPFKFFLDKFYSAFDKHEKEFENKLKKLNTKME